MTDVVLAILDPDHLAAAERKYAVTPPYSILALAHALREAGFSVAVFHQGGTTAIAELTALVERTRPLFVGFSLFTEHTILMVLDACRCIRESSATPIVVGGKHPTALPEQTLGHELIDMVCVGDGERTVVELAMALSSGRTGTDDLLSIRGIGFKREGRQHFSLPRPVHSDLDAFDLHIEEDLLSRYVTRGGLIHPAYEGRRGFTVISSRGCPWRCGFCILVREGRRFRGMTAERTIELVERLRRELDIGIVRFNDADFFANRRRAFAIGRGIGLPWIAQTRVDYLADGGEDFVTEARAAGCVGLRCGIESGSQRVLDFMEKDITVAQVREAIRLCAKHEIRLGLYFMHGIPTETWEETCETLDLIDEIRAGAGDAKACGLSIFNPTPGTPLFDHAVHLGFSPPRSLEGWARIQQAFADGRPQPEVLPYVDPRSWSLGYYHEMATRRPRPRSVPVAALERIARWRWQRRRLGWPVDYVLGKAAQRWVNHIRGLAARGSREGRTAASRDLSKSR